MFASRIEGPLILENRKFGLSLMVTTVRGVGAAREKGKSKGAEILACTLSAELVPKCSVVIDRDVPPWT